MPVPTSNRWTGYSKDRLLGLQQTILEKVEKFFNVELSFNSVTLKQSYIMIQPNVSINTVECVPSNLDATKTPVIFLHGYGAGIALYSPNMAGIALQTQRKCIGMDWLGMAASDRPEYTATDTKSALEYFTESFAKWKTKLNLGTTDVVAHSLGAYIAARHFVENESDVRKLVLVSPVGVPHPPEHNSKKIPWFFKFLRNQWSKGVTINGFLQYLGPGAYSMVDWVIGKRYDGDRLMGITGISNDDDTKDLAVDYMHQILTAPPAGEKALNHILEPGAWAREPLIDYMCNMKDTDVMFIYGDKDWMSKSGGEAVVKSMAKNRGRTIVEVIEGTHKLYSDNTIVFNEKVADFLE